MWFYFLILTDLLTRLRLFPQAISFVGTLESPGVPALSCPTSPLLCFLIRLLISNTGMQSPSLPQWTHKSAKASSSRILSKQFSLDKRQYGIYYESVTLIKYAVLQLTRNNKGIKNLSIVENMLISQTKHSSRTLLVETESVRQ